MRYRVKEFALADQVVESCSPTLEEKQEVTADLYNGPYDEGMEDSRYVWVRDANGRITSLPLDNLEAI